MGHAARALLAGVVLAALGLPASGVESDPLPVPAAGARASAVRSYNEGVKLLLDMRYPAAQQRLEEALRHDETLAEAHNNLAYCLRMQGAHNFERSLAHYNRALELKPDLAQAYMYRGVLFTQTGNLARARADHARLLALDPALAEKLDKVIAGSAQGDDRSGISAQYE